MTLANIETEAQQDATLDLVRAIRRAYQSPYTPHDAGNRAGDVVMFTVRESTSSPVASWRKASPSVGRARVSKKRRGKGLAARQAHFQRGARKRAAKSKLVAKTSQGPEALRLIAAQAVFRQAEDTAEPNSDAFPLYCEAFQRFYDLYNDHPQGFSSDTCLRHIRLIGWELWRADRRRFSIGSAIDITRELVRRHPGSALEWANLGDFLMNAARWDEALSPAQVACVCDRSYAPAWSTLARCYFGLGRTREGEEACQSAVQLTGFPYRPQGDLLLLGAMAKAGEPGPSRTRT